MTSFVVIPDPLTVGLLSARADASVRLQGREEMRFIGQELAVARSTGGLATVVNAFGNPGTLAPAEETTLLFEVTFSPALEVDEELRVQLIVVVSDESGAHTPSARSDEKQLRVVDRRATSSCVGPCPWYAPGGMEPAPADVRLTTGSAGGSISRTRGSSSSPSLAVGAGGVPIVAYEEDHLGSGTDIVVRSLQGDRWRSLGGGDLVSPLFASSNSCDAPSLAVTPAGTFPTVAWRQDRGNNPATIMLMQWDGAAWVGLGESGNWDGLGTGSEPAFAPAVAVDAAGLPFVAYEQEVSGVGEIHVKTWNGGGWVELGGSATGGGVSNEPAASSDSAAVVLDSAGLPIVAWCQRDRHIYLRRWTGAAWVELGGSASGGGLSGGLADSRSPALAFDGTAPIVAYVLNGEIVVRRFDGANWIGLAGSDAAGGISATASNSQAPAIAVDSLGRPWVAWQEEHTQVWGDIYLRFFDGSAWRELGGSASGGGLSNTGGQSLAPALALVGDEPVVVWEDDTANDWEIYGRHWDGVSWVEWGTTTTGASVSASPGRCTDTRIIADHNGQMAVAWIDSSAGNFDVYVRRLEGEQWNELGASASGGGVSGLASNDVWPSMAFAPNGELGIAWYAGWGTNRSHARFWNESEWYDLDESGVTNLVPDGSDSAYASLAFTRGSRPVVAWRRVGTPNTVCAAVYDGATWVGLGGSATGGCLSGGLRQAWAPVVAVDSQDRIVVVWEHEPPGRSIDIYAARWDGAVWQALGGSWSEGGISTTGGASTQPRLVIDQDDRPVVVWRDETVTPNAIYLRRFDNVGWLELAGSATGSGISQPDTISAQPAVALDQLGHPVVVWSGDYLGGTEVYLRRFDGVEWRELDGSATAGGVSNSEAASVHPGVAVGERGICVVWSEGLGSTSQVLVRCHP